MPPEAEMSDAFMARDPEYDGVFFTAVSTTGIFCRPTCAACKPQRENVSFYATTGDALSAGYRPCKRCRPLESADPAPDWVRAAIAVVEDEPAHLWRDRDLRSKGLDPVRLRRWFKAHHGMTFHAYVRARRLGRAHRSTLHGERYRPNRLSQRISVPVRIQRGRPAHGG